MRKGNTLGAAVVLMAVTSFIGPNVAAALAADSTTLTIYSSARPGAVPPELYRPSAQPGGVDPQILYRIPGYAMVKQERAIELKPGRSTIRFTDVAAQIEPTTVTFASLTDPKGTRVLEQNFEFDLVSTEKLLRRFLDRVITVDQVQGDKVASVSGTLLSTAGGVVLQREGQGAGVIVINGYSNLRFPDLPGGLITKPTLVWDVTTEKPGQHNTRVTYETKGMAWWADYNIIFAEGKDANSGVLDLGAWVSILNQSGAPYPEAKLKLIAGDVQRAPQPQAFPQAAMKRMAVAEAVDEAGFEEKAFFEYHLYTLGRPTTLPDNSTKQIELFPAARGVACEKALVYYGLPEGYRHAYGSPMTDRNFGTECNKKVDIYIRFKNKQEAGMGMPLPSGRIRVSKLDPADNTLEFIGEDTIDHTPKDEEVLIKLGSAFDVVGERKQVDFAIDTRRDWMEEAVEIKLRNHKTEAVKVIIKENLYRWANWEIKEKSHAFEKADARTVHFPVTIEKDGEVTVQYKVRYTW